mgnify:CR=1 FL=1
MSQALTKEETIAHELDHVLAALNIIYSQVYVKKQDPADFMKLLKLSMDRLSGISQTLIVNRVKE